MQDLGHSSAKAILPLVLLTLMFCSGEDRPEIKGRIEIFSNQKVLSVWGTHYEMGYAQGYLLGRNFRQLFDEYLVYDYFGYPDNYEINIRPFVIDHCTAPEHSLYADELLGLLDGWKQVCADSGWSTKSEALARELDLIDLYVAQFVPDFAGFHGVYSPLMCSSLSSWGEATQTDANLAGGVVYCRILDWSPSEILTENTVIVVYQPDDESEYGWVSFGYPFLIGCLSGVSEDGLCASYNLGNHNVLEEETDSFSPILWAVRQGLEADISADGSHTKDDVCASVKANPRFGTHIIHCAEPASMNTSSPACVIEANNTGVALRYATDEPDIAPDHLVATNHHRVLYPPAGCFRYTELLSELTADPEVTTQRAWELEDSVSTLWSVHKILIRPDNGDFYFTCGEGIGESLSSAIYFELDKLF